VLNKLTHLNFETILEQVIQLDLSTASRRDRSLDIIFEKVQWFIFLVRVRVRVRVFEPAGVLHESIN
jgi:hypothetical protein